MKAWPFPTVTLKGVVFVWMGEGQPVDPREDLPPELFDEPHTLLRWSCQVMTCNWILVLENTSDAHNCFFVHRNCISVLRNRLGGRPRTPLGRRTKIIKGVIANTGDGAIAPTERYYFDDQGQIPFQMYYPGVEGFWPIHRYRLLWTWIWDRGRRTRTRTRNQQSNGNTGGLRDRGAIGAGNGNTGGLRDPNRAARSEDDYDDWSGTRLPSISAKGAGGSTPYRSHRWAVPVERDMTRVCYINLERYAEPPSLRKKLYKGITWPFRNWAHNFNFRYADLDAERTCQYNIPEYLSATDSRVVVIRKLLGEYARGVRSAETAADMTTREDELVAQRNKEMLDKANSVHTDAIKEGLTRSGMF
jgi:hypothetical protein